MKLPPHIVARVKLNEGAVKNHKIVRNKYECLLEYNAEYFRSELIISEAEAAQMSDGIETTIMVGVYVYRVLFPMLKNGDWFHLCDGRVRFAKGYVLGINQ